MKIQSATLEANDEGVPIPISIKVVPLIPGLVDHIEGHWEPDKQYHTFTYHLARTFDKEGRVHASVKSTLGTEVPVRSIELWRIPMIKFESLIAIIHRIRPFSSPVNLPHPKYELERLRAFFQNRKYDDQLRLRCVQCSCLNFSSKETASPITDVLIDEFIDFGKREFGAFGNARLTRQARRGYKETNSVRLGYVAQEESY